MKHTSTARSRQFRSPLDLLVDAYPMSYDTQPLETQPLFADTTEALPEDIWPLAANQDDVCMRETMLFFL